MRGNIINWVDMFFQQQNLRHYHRGRCTSRIKGEAFRSGILAYYYLFRKQMVLPPGFRMLAGDNKMRALTVSVVDKPTSVWTDEEGQQPALSRR